MVRPPSLGSAVLLLVFLGCPGLAAALGTPSVFLDTDPLGSRIRIDGVLIADRTPALVRDLAPGPHTVSFWQEGYTQADRTFTVAPGPVPVVEVSLTPDSLVLAFPANPAVADGSGPRDTAGRQFRFPAGTYRMDEAAGTVRLAPAFADEGLLTAAGWALALTAGAAVLSGAADGWQISQGWAARPSLVTAGLAGAATLELPWFLSVSGRKDRFVRDAAAGVSPQAEDLALVRPLWDRGEEALQSGDLAGAEAAFARVVRDYPEAGVVPGAWFRLARIHALTGRRELALGEYRLVAATYPQAAYHDRARKALADLYEAAGDPDRALENLDALVPGGGFFDQADLDAQRARLAAGLGVPEPEAPGTDPTPREALGRAEALFAQGHPFTAEEFAGLAALETQLTGTGDRDLAEDLNLLRRGASAEAGAAEARGRAQAALADDGALWTAREQFGRDKTGWRAVRDGSLLVFTGATVATLLLAVAADRTDANLRVGVFSDGPARQAFANGLHGALAASAGTMVLSLLPLVWGEARQ